MDEATSLLEALGHLNRCLRTLAQQDPPTSAAQLFPDGASDLRHAAELILVSVKRALKQVTVDGLDEPISTLLNAANGNPEAMAKLVRWGRLATGPTGKPLCVFCEEELDPEGEDSEEYVELRVDGPNTLVHELCYDRYRDRRRRLGYRASEIIELDD